MSSSFVDLQGVSKSFADRQILDKVTLRVDRGESVVIIGQSGCGKSVLLKHILRLLKPDEGTVAIDGHDLAGLSRRELVKVRQRIGMLFQSGALFDSMTVAENVGLGLYESRLYQPDEIKESVREKLELVGLSSSADKIPAELSGGMRKRVGLARAIAGNPEIILYDEPTTGLDPITADMIDDLVVRLHKKLHVTTIAVTHDMKSAYKISGRIVMLYNGKIEFDGTVDEIKQTDNPVVRQFISGSAVGPIQAR